MTTVLAMIDSCIIHDLRVKTHVGLCTEHAWKAGWCLCNIFCWIAQWQAREAVQMERVDVAHNDNAQTAN